MRMGMWWILNFQSSTRQDWAALLMCIPALLLLLFRVYQFFKLKDLQQDLINPFDLCESLNLWVYADIVILSLLAVFSSLSFFWFAQGWVHWLLSLILFLGHGHQALSAWKQLISRKAFFDSAQMLDDKYVDRKANAILRAGFVQLALFGIVVCK